MSGGPSDPMGSKGTYAKKGAEPAKTTGPKGPQARGSTQGQHETTKPSGTGKLAAGPVNPKAKG